MIDIEAAFEEHFSYVYLYIRKLSHNEAIAEEITSETFFKALSAYVCGCVKSQRTVTSPTLKSSNGNSPLKVPTPMFPTAFYPGRWKPCFQRKPLWKYSGRSMGWMNRTRRSLCGGHLES